MSSTSVRSTDRVQSFLAAVDIHEPTSLDHNEDLFRIFARHLSRSLDGRYLDRHPPAELIPAIEELLACALFRENDEIKVQVKLIEDGSSTRGVLITTLPDQPFIVSVVRQALFWMSVRVLRSFQTVVEVRREATGRMSAVTTTDGQKEAMGWIEIEADNLNARASEIEEHIKQRLSFVTRSVADYPEMRTDIEACADRYRSLAESSHSDASNLAANAEFLEWVLAEHFVILGTRVLESDHATTAKSLGTGHEHTGGGIPLEPDDESLLKKMPQAPHLWVRKSQMESWIYRAGHLDHVFAQLFDESGKPNGVLLIEGLFSFQALAQARGQIPLLRHVLQHLITELQAEEGTHRHRSIRKAFNSLPLEYLFALSVEDIRSLVEQLLDADAEAGVQVQISVVQEQFAFAFIVLPRSYYSDDLRGEVRNLLRKRFESRSIDDGVYSGSDDTVAVHYFLTGTKSLNEREREGIENEIEQAAQPWSARLKDELFARHGEDKARPLYSLYREAFPRRYKEETSVARAVKDIELLEALSEDNPFACEVFREKQDKRRGITRLRIVERKVSLLSDILPILDYLGLIVIDQYPTNVNVSGRPESVVSTFRLRGVKNMNVDLMNRRNRLSAAIRSANLGAMDNDPLNRLLLRADIPWTYVTLIRSYHLYARQVGSPYGLDAVLEALERNADVVRSLTEYFRIKFDPGIDGLDSENVCDKRRDLIERSERTLQAQIARIADLNSDQIIRTFFNLIQSTLRTNFYNRDPYKSPQLVLKFNPAAVDRMPEPRPYREIYVHHPKVAGLHLRGGPVARGGIRWSDRRLDFRTEVLGLMHTQNLKNVVIVPRGAKGAFIIRETFETHDERRSAAEAGYRIFINGLLEVTDNLVAGVPVAPGNTLRYDDSDHYLVVAADKGTAHLSDTANGIGQDRGFWLGDAFASGGSNGYDHKVDGVTAKGAWECVKRHFREMGLHPEKDKIRVIGIGDMSGDVFGNGMLLSQTMQLVAAFDHRHIFIDPDPDPAKSWDARKMLFEKPRSNWMDYPEDAMSEGAGVYPRGAKSIKLSEQARTALGITEEEMSGPALIQHILAAPADLLWNGGIGTYIKSDKESNIDAGDPPNDSVRIDASRVRAKVIGEGGNLGITSKGRCQLASQGVRLNTDAIDNSGGVDLSDHEVNIKILLGLPLERGAIDQERRDFLLHDVRAGVNETVLLNNWIQSRMLSLDQLRSQRDLPRFQRALDHLSQTLGFKRSSLNLPGDAELELRIQKGEGLYRPELAVLASHAKLFMRRALSSSAEFSVERLSEYLLAYFPDVLVEEFKQDILNHPLGLDIAHAMFTNAVLGDAGCSWLTEMVTQTGEEPSKILACYIDASSLLSSIQLKKAITHVEDSLESTIEYLIRLQIEQALERATGWLLRRSIEDYKKFSDTFAQVVASFHELLPEHDEEARLASSADLEAAGMPSEAAVELSRFEHLDEILDITRLIMATGASTKDAARAFYLAGDQTGLLKLIRSSEQSYNTSKLEKPARAALRDLLRSHQVGIAKRILKVVNGESQALLAEIEGALSTVTRGRLDLSTLVIAADRVGRYTEE